MNAAEPALKASAHTLAVPVLIRNDENPVERITLENTSGKPLQVKSLEIQLGPNDPIAEIESIALFEAGPDAKFVNQNFISSAKPASSQVSLAIKREISPGKTVFWLSCRLRPSASLLHQFTLNCNQVETGNGPVEIRQTGSSKPFRIGMALRKQHDDGVHTYRIPALTTTKAGTLLAVYDMRRRMGRDLQEDIDIGLSRSTDGGQSWEPVKVIMDMGQYGGKPQELNGCSDPGMIVDRQTGTIFCFAVWMHGKPGKHQWRDDGSEPGFEIGKAAQMLMVKSTDDGKTWSKPENLTRQLKKPEWWLLAPAPQSGIQLADGTLVMPVQGRTGRGDAETFATVMTSHDHGQTWKMGNPGYSGGNECQVAQLGDGSLMLNIRNDHNRFRAVVVSKDLGQSWQPHETSQKTLIEPNCNGSLIRVNYNSGGEMKHALLFSNPHSQKSRTHQTLQLSLDD
ncbi:MAG: exo-alpha-sialidase, partial [bacterium]